MTLFQRCKAEHADMISRRLLGGGANAFRRVRGFRGAWVSGPSRVGLGVLYDNVTMDGGGLMLDNRETHDQGIGWAAANCVLWQCSAPLVTCRRPPRANNWAIGCWGQVVGDGSWQALNEFVKPLSCIAHSYWSAGVRKPSLRGAPAPFPSRPPGEVDHEAARSLSSRRPGWKPGRPNGWRFRTAGWCVTANC